MGEFPSKANQFGPGNNANPKGRPPGKSITTILREIGELAIATPATIESVKDLVDGLMALEGDAGWALTANQAAALRMWAIALHDYDAGQARRALIDIQNRTEGRVPLPIKNDDGPLEIRVVYADPPTHDPDPAPGAGDDPPEDETL